MNILQLYVMRCKTLVTVISRRSNLTQSFVPRKSVMTSASKLQKHTCYFTYQRFCCTKVYLLLSDEGSCDVISTSNNCYEFFASHGIHLIMMFILFIFMLTIFQTANFWWYFLQFSGLRGCWGLLGLLSGERN